MISTWPTSGLAAVKPNEPFLFTRITMPVDSGSYVIDGKDVTLIPPSAGDTPIDAESVKKIRNSFYAMKVVFFNQIYDILEKTEADYETIRSIVVEDPRIGNSHSFIFHKKYRGYGGACLPKDIDSLIDFAKKVGAPSELLETVKKLNNDYVTRNRT